MKISFSAVSRIFTQTKSPVIILSRISKNYHRTIKMPNNIQDDSVFTGVRLPENITPINYKLCLEPSFKDFTFKGKVEIELVAKSPTQKLQLHAIELEITAGKFEKSDLVAVTYGKSSEMVQLEFENKAEVGSGLLTLEFSGILNDKMKGFYRTSWSKNPDDPYAVTTQFEATDARRCFPCWDEPARKATFEVSVIFEKQTAHEYIALSNGSVLSREDLQNGYSKYSFARTKKMSTYLLALCVGPFENISHESNNRKISVYTMPGKKEQGEYALHVAVESLKYYEDYFNIAYPLEKLDLVAIPDFAAGAMENWGLVTYRETCLLVDPKNTSTAAKQYVALVVAHELAHQWFGNLVTMEWWTHLWLNEGFATFMEFLCVDKIFPEYDIWSQFVTDAYVRALNLDSLHNSHPIEVPVNHPSEIDEIFDAISYSKGASVIRMLYNHIGDSAFRTGMEQYLKKFSYKNALTEDLWDSLGAASQEPVREIMSGWTSQKGFPWISVKSEQCGLDIKLTLVQSKFNADGKIPSGDNETLWMIPFSYVTGDNLGGKACKKTLLDQKQSIINIANIGDTWVKLNPGTISLFRTAYSPELLERFEPAIQDKTLPPMDRLGLQNDFFALCQAGKVHTTQLLKLLSFYKNEDNYTVWNSIDICVGKLNSLLSYTDFQGLFHSFARELYSSIFKRVKWDPAPGEPHTLSMTRALVINRLVSLGDKGVIEEAQKRFKAQQSNPESNAIIADLRSAIYKAVSTYGDEASYEELFNIYRTAELHEEKNRAAGALGYAKDEARLKRVIDFLVSSEVRNQDKIFILMSVGLSNQQYAFNFLKTHKDFIRETYESGFLIGRIIKASTENFASEEKFQEVDAFFKENKFPSTERTIQQALETIRLNASWLQRDSADIKKFLA